jgi:hypothetical protein
VVLVRTVRIKTVVLFRNLSYLISCIERLVYFAFQSWQTMPGDRGNVAAGDRQRKKVKKKNKRNPAFLINAPRSWSQARDSSGKFILASGLSCSLKISVAEPEPQEAETSGWSRSHNEVLAPSQAQEIYTFLFYYLKIY